MDEVLRAIRSWNPWWMKGWKKTITVPRRSKEKVIEVLDARHVKDILGVRRAGKTTLLHQIIFHLLEKGVEPRKIMFLNFDDIALNTLPFTELLTAMYRLQPDFEYLFLDEVQEKRDWGRWVRKLYDLEKVQQIFITGSNASLLSEDMGRILTGRHMSFQLFPYSFREFLLANEWPDLDPAYLLSNNEKLLSYFDRYLIEGGFPESIGLDDNARERMFTNILNDILSRDVGGKHAVNSHKLRNLAKFLFTNMSNPYSVRNISTATGLNYDTVERYIGYLRDAFLVFDLPLFSYGLKKMYKQNRKLYVVDNGLRNHVSFRFSADHGRLAENLVFLELKRREAEVYYWKGDRKEVDFVVRSGLDTTALIQVCWNPGDRRTKKREIDGLIAACRELDMTEGWILTRDKGDTEEIDGTTVHYLPLSYWLLGIDILQERMKFQADTA